MWFEWSQHFAYDAFCHMSKGWKAGEVGTWWRTCQLDVKNIQIENILEGKDVFLIIVMQSWYFLEGWICDRRVNFTWLSWQAEKILLANIFEGNSVMCPHHHHLHHHHLAKAGLWPARPSRRLTSRLWRSAREAQCAYSINPVWLFRRPQFDFGNKFE